MASPNDTTYGVIREAVPGTTPATPAFKNFDYISGTDLSFDGKMVTSDVMKANRANAGAQLMNKVGGGGLKTHARRDSTTDMLIEGVVGNVFTADSVSGGSNDFSHTIEKVMVDKSTGSAVSSYHRWLGAYVSKMGLTVDASSNAEFSFEFVTMGKTITSSKIASATYTAPTQGLALSGNDVGVISIAGLTGIYTSLDFSIEQSREGIFGLGSSSAVAVNASASPRMIKLTAQMLRNGSTSIDAIAGTTVAVSFTIGSGAGNQYTFTMPKMVAAFPDDSISGAANVVSVEFTGIAPLATDTDITVTRA